MRVLLRGCCLGTLVFQSSSIGVVGSSGSGPVSKIGAASARLLACRSEGPGSALGIGCYVRKIKGKKAILKWGYFRAGS